MMTYLVRFVGDLSGFSPVVCGLGSWCVLSVTLVSFFRAKVLLATFGCDGSGGVACGDDGDDDECAVLLMGRGSAYVFVWSQEGASQGSVAPP